ncbi:hypothetical protein K2173_027581 [Erythroxylum novogranatense]|uniref:11-beta-hydroxysteroid dehydrogenase-like 4A n=1 Tax=Erythroxylum novogranatense TaxID=1862640 RepID=A0AAV8U2E5_9ROSI|nr:hypothetical protein K2173_027581 [Erythroxylum novogranatense]
MDLVHNLFSLLFPPLNTILLLCVLPLYLIIKLIDSLRRHFHSENVAGKVVIVTGAASGIGEIITYEYAKRRACLALVDIKEDCLKPVVDKARALGSPDVIAIVADVSKLEDCERFVNEAVQHFGKLDHLVNNAGMALEEDFGYVNKISALRRLMDVNFWGAVYGTQFALPHLRKSKGKIIAVASCLGWYPIPKSSFCYDPHPTSASKAALISFCESLRSEFGGEIGVTIVIPGNIRTDMTQKVTIHLIILEKSNKNFIIPSVSRQACGKAIVSSGCRGDNYLVVPSWVSFLFLWRFWYPEIADLVNRWAFVLRDNYNNKSKLNPSSVNQIDDLKSN